MNIFVLVIILVLSICCLVVSVPQCRVLFVVNLSGASTTAATQLDVVFLVKQWQNHLNERIKNVPTWPFNATVDLVDMKSNKTYIPLMLAKRLKDPNSPYTLVASPEDTNFGDLVATFCNNNGIPFVTLGNARISYPRLSIYGTSFFVSQPYVYQYIELINAFVDQGVKTIVSVAAVSTTSNINTENCAFAARYAATRGITLVQEMTYPQTTTTDDLTTVVRTLRDQYKPDAVLWCDLYTSLAPPSYIGRLHPISVFRNENYLPKALSFYDALDAPSLATVKAEGSFLYTSAGTFVCNRVFGTDYTEGNHDYSSMFRPSGTIASIYDQLNFGSTTSSPSSSQLFYAWYYSLKKKYPNKLSAVLWAGLDVMEAGMYRASKVTTNLADGKISWDEMFNALKYMQLTTPLGPIQFDDNGDNIAYKSLVVQSFSITDTADIIYPASGRTAEMVYPMPTWDERVYTWALLRDSNVTIAIIVACLCSALILAICITVIIKRREPEIRMLNYLHLVSICCAGLVVIWCLVFLWQSDNRPLQCQSFMWAIFLPASYMVNLVNVKAYRLSKFLVATATGMRPKPFSHLKVLRITLGMLLVSVVILGIIEAVDPPKRTLEVKDKYRPKLNEYRCVIQEKAAVLLYIYVIGHLIFSAFCVAAVRNGMEDFRDGMIMKESFMVLYICLAVAFIMGKLNLQSSISYLLRTVILTLGVTLFIFRFLGSRVMSYWIPEVVQVKLAHWHEIYLKPFLSSVNISTVSHVSKSQMVSQMVLDDEKNNVVDFDAPVYAKDVPKDDNLLEMMNVLKDPNRKKIFTDVSKQAMTMENVDFLCKVMDYEDKCARTLSTYSSNASDEMREEAVKIFSIHIKANSADEVNVSSSCRNQVDKKITDWSKQTPVISAEDAKRLLESDHLKRDKVFHNAFHEVSIMTYQNLWNKFRVAETNYLAMGQDESPVTDFK